MQVNIICMIFVSRGPSELGGVLALSKNKFWLTLMYLASNYKKKSSFFSFSEVQRSSCNAPFLYLSKPGYQIWRQYSCNCPSDILLLLESIPWVVPCGCNGSPCVPRAAPQDLWSSELSSQPCPACVPWGSWALSLGSIPAFRTQNTALLFRAPCPQTWPASLGLGCWIWGWDVLEHVLVKWVQLPNRSGWFWITDILIFITSASSENVTGSGSLGFFVRSFDKILNYLGLNQIYVAQNTAAGWCSSHRSYWNSLVERWGLILLIREHRLFSPKAKERGKAVTVSNGYQFYPGLICWKGNIQAEAGVMHSLQETLQLLLGHNFM